MPNFISEDEIERAILKLLKEQFGYDVLNCSTSDSADLNDRSGRADKRNVIFADHLKDAALRYNKGMPEPVIVEAMVRRILGIRHVLSPDSADALALALCHAHHQSFSEASGRINPLLAAQIPKPKVKSTK
ncbi:MAG: type I site-specific deoxyribonuclease HsdR family [Nitrospirae bacterium]|nr:MAG: type I site-specific deoxyribonuclease HsdR family [Nitrospirota bacterium]